MCDINSTSFYPEPSLGRKSPFIDVKRQIRGRMITVDFGSLQRRTKRYWRKTKWCSVFVLFTLANLLITICISAVWSSQESQVFAKLSVNTCVMLACSFLVIKQRLDANKSIRSEQLAFEGLTADFKGVEASNDRLRMELSESQLKCIDLQTKLDAATLDLEKARRENDGFREELKGAKANEKADLEKALEALKKELAVAQEKLDLIKSFLRDEITAYDTLSDADVLRLVLRAINERDWLRKKLEGAEASSDRLKGSLKRSLTNCRKLRKELSTTKRELEDAYNNLDSAYDMLRDKSVAVDKALQNAETLQDRLNTARRISVRRLIERNELQDQNDGLRKELHEAKMDLEWSRGLRADAKEQAASLENILKNLDEATEIADLREKLKMVINRLSSEDSRE